jgi:hypothetical protein
VHICECLEKTNMITHVRKTDARSADRSPALFEHSTIGSLKSKATMCSLLCVQHDDRSTQLSSALPRLYIVFFRHISLIEN